MRFPRGRARKEVEARVLVDGSGFRGWRRQPGRGDHALRLGSYGLRVAGTKWGGGQRAWGPGMRDKAASPRATTRILSQSQRRGRRALSLPVTPAEAGLADVQVGRKCGQLQGRPEGTPAPSPQPGCFCLFFQNPSQAKDNTDLGSEENVLFPAIPLAGGGS